MTGNLKLTGSALWRGWLLLAVAVWIIFAPAAIAAGLPRFLAEPASVGGEGSSAGPGLHIYLYAHAAPLSYVDPSGHFASLTELFAAMAISATLNVAIAIPSIVQHWDELSVGDIAAKLGKEAGEGAVSGLIGGVGGKLFLKLVMPKLTWLFGKAVIEGAAGAGLQQLAKEVWDVLNGKPIEIGRRTGRIVLASAVGAFAGSVTFRIQKYLDPVVTKTMTYGKINAQGFLITLPYGQIEQSVISWYGVAGATASELFTDAIQEGLEYALDLDSDE